MPTFRFRAQAALDLRKREFDIACRDLAEAERVRDAARDVLEQAVGMLSEARAAGHARVQQRGTVTDWHWYRIWILRLDHERAAAAARLAEKDAVVERHCRVRDEARQRYESLERFREKAWQRVVAAEREVERKLLDELATRRFLSERRAEGVSS